jgi:hypothetical protein
VGALLVYGGYRQIEADRSEDDDGPAAGMAIGDGSGMIAVLGVFVIGLSAAGAIATLIAGGAMMSKARKLHDRSRPRRRQLVLERNRTSFALAPLVGPNGTLGAGALIRF